MSAGQVRVKREKQFSRSRMRVVRKNIYPQSDTDEHRFSSAREMAWPISQGSVSAFQRFSFCL
jgi:hypothetical protein